MNLSKKMFDRLLIIFLFLNPILDAITAYQLKYNIGSITIGTLIRGLFLYIIIFYMIKNNIKRKHLLVFVIYIILATCFNYFYLKNPIVSEVSNLTIIFYLPILIYFFKNLDNELINDKLIFILYLVYVNFIIVPYIFGFGFHTYPEKYNKWGFMGVFYSGNEISAILIGLLPVVVNYLINHKNIFIKLIFGLEILVAIFMVGTRTLIMGLAITIMYFIFKFIKNNYKKLTRKIKFIGCGLAICIVITSIVVLPKLPIVKNAEIAFKYYNINKFSELFTFKTLDKIIFSERLTFLKGINKYYFARKIPVIIFGLGRTGLLAVKDVELDIFDIFYSIGFIGSIVYLIFMIDGFKKTKFKDYYILSLLLFMLMSLTSGHVLIRPMVSIYFAIIFILNKNSKKVDKSLKRK